MDNYMLEAFRAAYHQASLAYQNDEVPVGAVVVRERIIIAADHNRIVELHDPTAHAEILALRKATETLGNERLGDCELFTTLEPCAMCAGAIILSRISKVYFLSQDEKLPGLRAVLMLKGHNHYPQWELAEHPEIPAGELLKKFFREKRLKS